MGKRYKKILGKIWLSAQGNVIVNFRQDNFEIQLIGTHEPEVLKQVWKVARRLLLNF